MKFVLLPVVKEFMSTNNIATTPLLLNKKICSRKENFSQRYFGDTYKSLQNNIIFTFTGFDPSSVFLQDSLIKSLFFDQVVMLAFSVV